MCQVSGKITATLLTSERPNMNQKIDAPHYDTQFLGVKCLDPLGFHLPMPQSAFLPFHFLSNRLSLGSPLKDF